MQLHDLPAGYLSGTFERPDFSPETLSGTWNLDSGANGGCELALDVRSGGERGLYLLWLERSRGDLRVDFIYSDPDLHDVMRYQHRPARP